MRIRHLFLLPSLLITSCSDSLTDEPEEKAQPKIEETAPEEELPTLPPPVDESMKFAVPESTGKLMTEENRKTIVGPVPTSTPATEGDSVINVDPPELPEAKLPDEE